MASRKSIIKWVIYIYISFIFLSCSSSTSDLSWVQENHYRWAEVNPGYFGGSGFDQLSSSKTKIFFKNEISEKEITNNRHYLNGSGVAAGDFDNDGLTDIYFARLDGPNVLYKNMGGMEFKDVTEEAGVSHTGYYSTGVVFADVNGDEFVDLLVTSLHKENALYINNRNGGFERKEDSGLGSADGSMTMTLADIDSDGDLDLYIVKYKEQSIKDIYSTEELSWENILEGDPSEKKTSYTLIPPFDEHYQTFVTDDNVLAGVSEAGEEDALYINQGDGTFEKVFDSSSVFVDEQNNPTKLERDWGLAAKFQDLNKDGLPDLYVCNDFYSPDRIWINQGNGRFKAISSLGIRNSSFSSMAVDFSDINRDGLVDIFVTEMLSSEHQRRMRQMGSYDPNLYRAGDIEARPQYNRNSLYLQQSDNSFSEISYLSGLEASEWSWATKFVDINLDGFEDLIINTGYTYDILDIDTQIQLIQLGINMDEQYGEFISRTPSLDLPNKMFMNNGDLTFQDKSASWGFEESDVAHGLAMADFDNDGDLDFAINRLNKTAAIYENASTSPRIAVKLRGSGSNTKAVGAKIKLEGGPQPQEKEITAGGDYLSGSDYITVFAASKTKENHSIIVAWPNGQETRIDSVRANRIYEIDQVSLQSQIISKKATQPDIQPVFIDISERINHQHQESNFDDFSIQPLLPKKLSSLGPGIAWIDYDNDGDDDLFITSGNGGNLSAFLNNGQGYFEPMSNILTSERLNGDQTAILGWNTNQNTHLVIGIANYETGDGNAPSAHSYLFENEELILKDSLRGMNATTGPLAIADYDQDGDLDLFVGGRFMPGQYPKPANSLFFENNSGKFQLDRQNSRKFQNKGLITGATFTDYDQDGDPDLLLSLEWGSLQLYRNNGGNFEDVTEEMGLSDYLGWWNGVTTGDFNNDGLPDIVATNQGLNSPYQLKFNRPFRMYYGDFNGDRRIDIIEAEPDKKGNYLPVKKQFKYNSLPVISNKGMNYHEFSNTTLKDIFGDNLPRVSYKEINNLKHMLFLNTGDGFDGYDLPVETQFSTAFYAGVADFNNDGNEDLFLSQNFFGVPEEVPRQDGGKGIWLKGNGEGDFSTIQTNESGINIYGEQRGAALSDFNKDGKIDLAVSQNNAMTKLYLNQTPEIGIRIQLDGSPENKDAIGSSLRLVYSNGEKGPLREINAGSGYLSQNSVTQILGSGQVVESIEITWPDGTRQIVKINAGQKTYTISKQGEE